MLLTTDTTDCVYVSCPSTLSPQSVTNGVVFNFCMILRMQLLYNTNAYLTLLQVKMKKRTLPIKMGIFSCGYGVGEGASCTSAPPNMRAM